MDARTAEALEASINHWQQNVGADDPNKASCNASDCALCSLFFRGREICKGCPVAERSGDTHCSLTPYNDALDAFEKWQISHTATRLRKWRTAAQAELDFLVSLREPVEATPAMASS